MESKGHYIDGEWRKAKGELFNSHNPATSKLVWQGGEATDEEVGRAIAVAACALEGWQNRSLEARADHLKRFRSSLERSKDSLAKAISEETGKPLWESKTEVASMIGKVDISFEAYHNRCNETSRQAVSQAISVTRYKPHGVVAVLSPFNFPGHLPNGHLVPALLAGNTIVFKPSEFTPRVGEAMMECWQEATLPAGVLNMVQGGKKTGKVLAEDPRLNALFFTGSSATGKWLSEHFGKHPEKLLALEMGGNNPLVVSAITDFEAAAYLVIQSAYITTGQRCSCARRLILIDSEKSSSFLNILLAKIKKIVVGPYTNSPEPYMGPVISEAAANHLLSQQRELIENGGTPLLEMKSLQPKTAFLSPGLIDMTKVKKRPDIEIFGPLLQLICVADMAAAIKEANATEYGLTAGLLSDSQSEYDHFYRHLRSGIINWNIALTGANSSAPFGGVGLSGNHRPSAYYAADYCAYPTASLEKNSVSLPAELPPGLQFSHLIKNQYT